ncbi:MAG: glycosyltransferase [Candidatus Eisenbacteria bacterium]
MNVAILIGRFPPHDIGAAERQADRLAAGLAARGHRVTVITRRWPGRPGRELRDGFTIVRTPILFSGPARSLLDLVATLMALRGLEHKPDAILAFQTFASGWIAGFADVFLGIPAITWVRGENEYRFDRFPHLYRASVFAWRQARRNLVQSQGHREQLLAQVARRDPLRSERIAQRIDVLGNGVDLPPQVVSGGDDWLFVGRLIAHKGVDVLLEALARMPASGRRPLWILGDGPERATLEARARALGVDARFEGFVERAKLPAYYARARAIVLPSTEGEGLPNALLEAMAYGVPVVTTTLVGMEELVGAGGRLVPPGDPDALAAALLALSDPANRAERDRAAVAARGRAEVHDWASITDRLEVVLREIAVRAPRVWLVSPNPTSRGGVAAVARQIAISPITRKYRISMVPTYAPGTKLERSYRAAHGILLLGGAMIFKRPDLVHVKVASGGSFVRKVIVGMMCRLRGVPVLVHVHGGGFDQFVRNSPRLVKALARWLIESHPIVLCLSPRWARKLEELFPRAHVEVMPNPVEVSRFGDLARARFARPVPAAPEDPAPIALFLGEVLSRKGVPDLIEAWPRVVRAIPGARLVLAGGGDLAPMQAAARRAGVEARVEFPGWIELAEKRRMLGEATLFVLPSHIEGVPISMLEAMAAGLPCVVTPVGGILDAVSDGREALIVPVGEPEALSQAILRILQSPGLARELGVQGRERVNEFDLPRFAERLDAVYQRVLASEHPPEGVRTPALESSDGTTAQARSEVA